MELLQLAHGGLTGEGGNTPSIKIHTYIGAKKLPMCPYGLCILIRKYVLLKIDLKT